MSQQAQLATSTITLLTTKDEVKKLQLQLTSEAGDFEAIVFGLNKKHDTQTKSLEETVCYHIICTNGYALYYYSLRIIDTIARGRAGKAAGYSRKRNM